MMAAAVAPTAPATSRKSAASPTATTGKSATTAAPTVTTAPAAGSIARLLGLSTRIREHRVRIVAAIGIELPDTREDHALGRLFLQARHRRGRNQDRRTGQQALRSS